MGNRASSVGFTCFYSLFGALLWGLQGFTIGIYTMKLGDSIWCEGVFFIAAIATEGLRTAGLTAD